METTRRTLLQQASGGVALAAGFTGFPTIIRAAEPITVTYAQAAGGVSAVVDEYMSAKRFDLKHGVNIKTINSYVSIPSYYADLTAGTFDLGIGAWDTFYRMFTKGVPIKLVTTVTSGILINFVTGAKGMSSVKDLRGKSIAAISGSGALAMFGVLMKKQYGIDVDKDLTLQNVQNPSAAMTLLLAGNVDGALSWEPYISTTLQKDNSLRPIFNVGTSYKELTGEPLPYFSCVIRDEVLKRNPDVGRRIAAAFAECCDSLTANRKEAFVETAPRAKLDLWVLNNAFDNGRLQFLGSSMAEPEGRRMMKTAFDIFGAAEGMTGAFDEKFFIS
jgi:NitT/TauT family transport system substrate-binding protein